MFRIGQRVECVNDTNADLARGFGDGHMAGLRRGAKYTVCDSYGAPGYERCVVAGIAGSWRQIRFRPIVEKKTDISIFTALLSNVPKHEREVVDHDQ